MTDITQTIVLVVLAFLLDRILKSYLLRKWLGVTLLVTGVIGCVTVGNGQVLGFDLELLSVVAVPMGVLLFLTRRRFVEVG
ncbi:hypothetical protein PS910_03992 [Pseudomonas fluorescens]|nr:hypothetical protein PS910_03992 [Pseudomonas fluorescens]